MTGPSSSDRAVSSVERSPVFKSEKLFFLFTFLFYLVMVMALFHEVMFQGASFVKRDIVRFYYPVWNFSVGMMKDGVFPLWNPYNSYGAPFFADIQTCVLYPLTLLLYLPDYCWAFNFYVLVHLALAGFFTAVWMRECGASREASFLSGLAFALGGYVMSAISLTISLATLVYFPLVLLTFRRSFRTPGLFWKGMAALTLLVQYLAGDPAVFFATLVVLTLFVITRTLAESFARKKPYLKFAGDLAKVLGLFLGLSLFHTLLFFEFLMHSNRALLMYDEVTLWSVQYNDLVSFFFPYFSDLSIFFMDYWERQSWLENAYAGITVVLLACAGLRGVRRSNLIGYHVLLALFGVALALGRFCSVYWILYHTFPFFKFIRYPVRFLFLFSFAVACLAGFGLDEVLSRLRRREGPLVSPRQAVLGAFSIVFIAALVVLGAVYSAQIESAALLNVHRLLAEWTHRDYGLETLRDLVLPVLFNLRRMGIFICLFLAGLFLARHFRPRAALLAFFFTLIVFSDLAEVNVIEIQLDGKVLQRPSQNLTRVAQDRGLFRVFASPQSVKLQYQPPDDKTFDLTLSSLRETLTPNLLLPYRIGDISGYDSIFLRDSIDINRERYHIKDPTRHRFYDMLNIKYMVTPRDEIGGGYRLVNRAHPTNLFLNERALPRAFFIPAAEVVKERKEILKKITAADFDPKRLLYLEEPFEEAPAARPEVPSAEDRVSVTRYSPNRVTMDLRSSRPQWLFLSDMYYPGWKAVLDGRLAKIYKANYAFRAVRVGPGAHRLEWKYDPILFKIGCGVSWMTFLGLMAVLWRERRLRA